MAISHTPISPKSDKIIVSGSVSTDITEASAYVLQNNPELVASLCRFSTGLTSVRETMSSLQKSYQECLNLFDTLGTKQSTEHELN